MHLQPHPASRWALASLLSLAAIRLFGQAWELDSSFGPSITNERSAEPYASYVAAGNSQFLVYGDFTHVNGVRTGGLARLNLDGRLDSTFAAEVGDEVVQAAVALADGRVLVALGGSWVVSATGPRGERDRSAGAESSAADAVAISLDAKLIRLNSDGRRDATFSRSSAGMPPVQFTPLPDGRIFAWGLGLEIDGVRSSLIRLNRDGTADRSFVPPLGGQRIISAAAGSDGSIVVFGAKESIAGWRDTLFARLQPSGQIDPRFAPTVMSSSPMMIQPDGAVVTGTDGWSLFRPARYKPTGEIDPTYRLNIPGLTSLWKMKPLTGGRMVVEAEIGNASGVFVIGPNGDMERDLRTATGAAEGQQLLGVLGDNRVLIWQGARAMADRAYRSPFDPAAPTGFSEPLLPPLAQYSPNLFEPAIAVSSTDQGSLASLPTTIGRRTAGAVKKLEVDATGRVLAAGPFTHVNDQPRGGIARFLPNGTLDPGFVPPGGDLMWVARDGSAIVRRIAIGPIDFNGLHRYVFEIVRVRSDGAVDPSFVFPDSLDPGYATWLAATEDGRYLVAAFERSNGRETNLRLFWLGPDGRRLTILTTSFPAFTSYTTLPADPIHAPFGPGVIATKTVGATIRNMLYAAQGVATDRLLVAGAFARVNTLDRPGLVRLQSDGTPDVTYVPETPGMQHVTTATLLREGGAIVFGSSVQSGRWKALVMRLRADGSVDPSFAPPADTMTNGARQLADGSFFSAGRRFSADGWPDLNFDRELDNQFSWAEGNSAVMDANGRLWVGGQFIDSKRRGSSALVRFSPREVRGITIQPKAQSAVKGRPADLQVAVGTQGNATYQWLRNGTAVPGGTNASLRVASVNDATAGSYRVVVTLDTQSFLSEAAALTPLPSTSAFSNFSARSRVDSDHPQAAGLSLADGAPRTVLFRAIARGLPAGMGGAALPNPILSLYDRGRMIAEDRGGAATPANVAMAQSFWAFPLNAASAPAGSNFGSALAPILNGGQFSAVTTPADSGAGLSLFEYYGAPAGASPLPLRNLSVRGQTGVGADLLTVGLVITGNGPVRLLLRGIGPGLARFGLAGSIADPQLSLFSSEWGAALFRNSGWANDAVVADAAERSGAFSLAPGSRDAAIVVSLEPGTYTIQLASTSGAAGTAMLEAYVVPE